MAIHGKYMAIHGYTWVYMAIHWYTWLYFGIHGNTWLYMTLHGYTFHYMGIHDITWLFLYISWYTLITLLKVPTEVTVDRRVDRRPIDTSLAKPPRVVNESITWPKSQINNGNEQKPKKKIWKSVRKQSWSANVKKYYLFWRCRHCPSIFISLGKSSSSLCTDVLFFFPFFSIIGERVTLPLPLPSCAGGQ